MKNDSEINHASELKREMYIDGREAIRWYELEDIFFRICIRLRTTLLAR